MELKDFLATVKLSHAFLLSLASIIGMLLAIRGLPEIQVVILAIAAPFFVEIMSFTLNDIFDVEADRVNKRQKKPMAVGRIKPIEAWVIVIVSFVLGAVSAYMVNLMVFWIVIVFSFLSVLYSVYLKKMALIGNAAIGASMAIPFIYGDYVVSQVLEPNVLFMALLAFLLGLGRELSKSIQDVKGDRTQGRRTMPIVVGEGPAASAALLFYVSAVLLVLLPFFLQGPYYYDVFYLVPVLAAGFLTLVSARLTLQQRNFEKIRRYTMFAMLLALLGFLLGVFL